MNQKPFKFAVGQKVRVKTCGDISAIESLTRSMIGEPLYEFDGQAWGEHEIQAVVGEPEKPTIGDGGSAFPGILGSPGYGNSTWQVAPSGETIAVEHNQGMTLRDWFAGQALAGISTGNSSAAEPDTWNWQAIAKVAYFAADAMLKARGQ